MVLGAACCLHAQTAQPSAQTERDGKILFQSHGAPPDADADRTPMTAETKPVGAAVTDSERGAVRVERYDLDVHVTPATSAMAVHARLVVRNAGAVPLARLALQVSSSLHWESAALLNADGRTTLTVAQEAIETDTDHTGAVSEAVLVLPRPLLPDATATLDVLYMGTVAASSERLRRIGADAQHAAASDWDAVDEDGVALRGFGNVIWYPVASPAMFLGEGARLFDAVGAARLRGQTTHVQLHLAVDYTGAAPFAAVFDGSMLPLEAHADAPNGASVTGAATADFPDELAGFRTLDLFTLASAPTALPVTETANPILDVVTEKNVAVLPRLSNAVEQAAKIPQTLFGAVPLKPLLVLDHAGQPFEDDAFLAAPVESLASSDAMQALVHSLTHAWIATGQPWMDEGLAQFLAVQYVEQQRGRDAALGEMRVLMEPLSIAEPDPASGAVGEPLIGARDEVFYRRKAAAVWWMLRDLAGDTAFHAALAKLRAEPRSAASPEQQAVAFEKLLEAESHTDLAWFFSDWVLHDRGLPDLSIVDVTPRPLPAGQGHDSGWLVAVTVHNDGTAQAEVPLVVQSDKFSVRRRVRVPANSSVTERVLVESAPSAVVLNDGSVPEVGQSKHSRTLNIQQQAPGRFGKQ